MKYLLRIMQIMHYLNGHNYSYHLQSTPLTLTVDAFIAKTHNPSIFCCFPFRCCFYFLSYFSAHPVKVLDFHLRASAQLFIFHLLSKWWRGHNALPSDTHSWICFSAASNRRGLYLFVFVCCCCFQLFLYPEVT